MWTATGLEKCGVVVCNFDSQIKHSLRLLIGDVVVIKEQCCDWYRGFSLRNSSVMGIFPASYIHLSDSEKDSNSSLEYGSSLFEDPIVAEVTSVLKEWNVLWKKLYVEHQSMLFSMINILSLELIDCRRLLMSGTQTLDQTRELKFQIVKKIDNGNKMLNLDLVPRRNYALVDTSKTNPLELYEIHEQTSKNIMFVHSSVTSLQPDVSVYQLVVSLTDFIGTLNQDYEIHFRLCNGTSLQFLSESFVTRSSKLIRSFDRNAGITAIFTDLCEKDVDSDVDLVLVAYVYKIGGLKDGEVTKTPVAVYRRPLGCGVQRVNQVFGENFEDYKFYIKLVSCSESEFAQFHESMIRKQSSSSLKSASVSNVELTLLVRSFKGSFKSMIEVDPRLSKNGTVIRRMGFPDVIMPDLLRNDLFISLVKADIEKAPKASQQNFDLRINSSPRNIELRLIVLDREGNKLQDCIHPGSGEPCVKEYNSAILYHSNTPRWNETVRLELSIEQYQDLHLRLELRHCSRKDRTGKKLFGFAFVPLSANDGTFLNDGRHELTIFKCDDIRKLNSGPPFYLSYLPYTSATATADSVVIETMLCSTKLTQNAGLSSLLKWRTEPSKLYNNLERLMKLEGKEVMKFLPDILDALFGMMSVNAENHQELLIPLAFKALVYILSLLKDKKFSQFWNVVENYIEHNFSASLAHRLLMNSLCATLEDFMSTTEAPCVQETFQKTFQVLDSIGKFIVQSRLLHCRTHQNRNSGEFLGQVHTIFSLINKVVAMESSVVIQPQIALVKLLPAFWIHLSQVLDAAEIYQIIIDFVSAIPKKCNGELNHVKLWCMKTVAKSQLFTVTANEAKIRLMKSYMEQLRRHLVNKSELKRCCSVLCVVIKSLYNDQRMGIACQTYVQIILDNLLHVMVQTVATMDKSSNLVGRFVVCTLAILKLMDNYHYERLIYIFKDKQPLRGFLFHVMNMCSTLVEDNIFPKDWIFMKLSQSHILFSTIQLLGQTMSEVFLSGPKFDLLVWHAYFNALIKFITQPCLQLERFSVNKRQNIVQLYGDMRLLAARTMMSSWQKLGEHKFEFVPAFVGLFLDVTFVPMTELRKLTLPILYDLMECEEHKTGGFHQVENELIDKLDILISEGKGDYEYQQLFTSTLLGKLEPSNEWHQSGTNFIHSMSTLIERLLDYRHVITSDDSREKQMMCIMNLLVELLNVPMIVENQASSELLTRCIAKLGAMPLQINFYKTEESRVGMYVRNVYKLYNIHIACGNHTEAAMTLELHAELLDWTDEPLPASLSDPKLSQQLKWQGKESIFLRIIDEFNKGKSWEYGLPFCEELAAVYKSKVLYEKLSFILNTQSEFYTKILKHLRGPPEYFRVGLYGQKFPLFLRNKEFIYRGNEYEKLETFQCHFLSEFSDATIMTNNRPPTDEIKMADVQYVQICHVNPVADIDPRLTADGVPSSVSAFYRFNDVLKFKLDRPYFVGDKVESEVKTMHIERTTLETSEKLPGILRWLPVTNRQTQTLIPLEVAVDTMKAKNAQLETVISEHQAHHTTGQSINPLTMSLNGVIDAAVMGGIAKYQEAFLTDEYLNLHPECSACVDQLKELIRQQVLILKCGLDVHRRLAPDDLKPLQQRMEEMFAKMKLAISKQISLSGTSLCSYDEPDSDQSSRRESQWTIPEVIDTPTPASTPTLSRLHSLEPLLGKLRDSGKRRSPSSNTASTWYTNSEENTIETGSTSELKHLDYKPQEPNALLGRFRGDSGGKRRSPTANAKWYTDTEESTSGTSTTSDNKTHQTATISRRMDRRQNSGLSASLSVKPLTTFATGGYSPMVVTKADEKPPLASLMELQESFEAADSVSPLEISSFPSPVLPPKRSDSLKASDQQKHTSSLLSLQDLSNPTLSAEDKPNQEIGTIPCIGNRVPVVAEVPNQQTQLHKTAENVLSEECKNTETDKPCLPKKSVMRLFPRVPSVPEQTKSENDKPVLRPLPRVPVVPEQTKNETEKPALRPLPTVPVVSDQTENEAEKAVLRPVPKVSLVPEQTKNEPEKLVLRPVPKVPVVSERIRDDPEKPVLRSLQKKQILPDQKLLYNSSTNRAADNIPPVENFLNESKHTKSQCPPLPKRPTIRPVPVPRTSDVTNSQPVVSNPAIAQSPEQNLTTDKLDFVNNPANDSSAVQTVEPVDSADKKTDDSLVLHQASTGDSSSGDSVPKVKLRPVPPPIPARKIISQFPLPPQQSNRKEPE